MTTLHDVARTAGVSAATVSHVINGTRRVSPATIARVHSAIAQLNFVPNQIGHLLAPQEIVPGVSLPALTASAETSGVMGSRGSGTEGASLVALPSKRGNAPKTISRGTNPGYA